MKVALVNPNSDFYLSTNLGLTYVISAIEDKHRIKLLDAGFHVKNFTQYVLDNIESYRPDVVGFSVTSFSVRNALKIAKLIKLKYPQILLVFGGVHPTLLPQETIVDQSVDAICIGEGEDAFAEYLDYLSAGRQPLGVAGIWFKDSTGKIIRNPLRQFRQDLDGLRFPNWDYWDIEKRLNINESSFIGGLRFITSRGCPYTCTFCSNPALGNAVPGKFYRLRSPENIVSEIKHNVDKYYDRGFRHVVWGDESFGIDIIYLRKLFELYNGQGFNKALTWSCQPRADFVTDEWAQLAKESGCNFVCMGVESADENIRFKTYDKNISNQDVREAVKILVRHRIEYAINMIVGCPEDSFRTICGNIKLLKELRPARTMFLLYQPLPKTELGQMVMADKTFKINYDRMFERGPRHRIELPVVNTRYLSITALTFFIFWLDLRHVMEFIITGLRLKGMRFIADIYRQFRFLILNNRPILHAYSFAEIEVHTTLKYLREKNKTRILRS
ncbi:MAG: radical SAM protein [Candidatus Omnitrophota bacterium]